MFTYQYVLTVALLNFVSVYSQTCSYQLTDTNIVSNSLDMSTTVVRVLSSGETMAEHAADCETYCERGWRMPGETCLAYSVSTEPLGTCYLYSNIVQSKLETTGVDRLYQQRCTSGAIDCVYSSWTVWGSCSNSCGGGQQRRTRTINTQGSNGGEPCDPSSLMQTQPCNTIGCPVNCDYSSWTMWTTCSLTCGSGRMSRSRQIVTQASNGGLECDHSSLTQSQVCNTTPCPQDCILTPWSGWTVCSVTCGGGEQVRNRNVQQPSANGGSCGVLQERQLCNLNACPVDCIVTNWSQWTACSQSCGSGTTTRSRSVITEASNGGSCNPQLHQSQICNSNPCAVDCILSYWSNWGSCTVTCGSGTQSRDRSVITPASNGGFCSSVLSTYRNCNTHACAMDCVLSEWGRWTACSESCGGGTRIRSRTILQTESNGGSCPRRTEYQNCNINSCPADCVLSVWSPWTSCSHTCGTGSQKRYRNVEIEESNGGTCPKNLIELKSCNTQACPTDCTMSSWSAWQECSVTCGEGYQRRQRSIVKNTTNGGSCFAPRMETRTCELTRCPLDCTVSHWSPWSSCSVSCGQGTRARKRFIETQATDGGMCPFALSETRVCTMSPCKSECILSDWSPWQTCSVTCGGGVMSRERTVIQGPCSDPLTETQQCNSHSCTECIMSSWSSWGSCSLSCGGGDRIRTRQVLQGVCVLPTTQVRSCNAHTCTQHCLLSQWSLWSQCSKSCGTGVKERKRLVLSANCKSPKLKETMECSIKPSCQNSPCTVSMWSVWSPCTVTCGNGIQMKNREIVTESTDGTPCSYALQATKSCNSHACKTEETCVLSQWSVWSHCSVTCGVGLKNRSRTVIEAHGQHCSDSLISYQQCHWPPCTGKCEYSSWSVWSSCSKTCGQSTRQRKRTVLSSDNHAKCNTVETANCNLPACSTREPCQWGRWSECSVSCGLGRQTRDRNSDNCRRSGPWKEFRNCYRDENCQPKWYFEMMYRFVNVTTRSSSAGYKRMHDSESCEQACIDTHEFECSAYVTDGNDCVLHGEIDKPIFLEVESDFELYEKKSGRKGVAKPHVVFYSDYKNLDPEHQLSSLGYFSAKNESNCTEICINNTEFSCRAYVTDGNDCYLHGKIDQSLLLKHDSSFEIFHRVSGSVSVPSFKYPSKMVKYSSIEPKLQLSTGGFEIISKTSNCSESCENHTNFDCEAFATDGKKCYLHGAIDQNINLQRDSPLTLFEKFSSLGNNFKNAKEKRKQQISLLASPVHTICSFEKAGRNVALNTTAAELKGAAASAAHCELLCKLETGSKFACDAYAYSAANCALYSNFNTSVLLESDIKNGWDLYVMMCAQ